MDWLSIPSDTVKSIVQSEMQRFRKQAATIIDKSPTANISNRPVMHETINSDYKAMSSDYR